MSDKKDQSPEVERVDAGKATSKPFEPMTHKVKQSSGGYKK
jgi:hypothetical protein